MPRSENGIQNKRSGGYKKGREGECTHFERVV